MTMMTTSERWVRRVLWVTPRWDQRSWATIARRTLGPQDKAKLAAEVVRWLPELEARELRFAALLLAACCSPTR
jgi:hypothetical protein